MKNLPHWVKFVLLGVLAVILIFGSLFIYEFMQYESKMTALRQDAHNIMSNSQATDTVAATASTSAVSDAKIISTFGDLYFLNIQMQESLNSSITNAQICALVKKALANEHFKYTCEYSNDKFRVLAPLSDGSYECIDQGGWDKPSIKKADLPNTLDCYPPRS